MPHKTATKRNNKANRIEYELKNNKKCIIAYFPSESDDNNNNNSSNNYGAHPFKPGDKIALLVSTPHDHMDNSSVSNRHGGKYFRATINLLNYVHQGLLDTYGQGFSEVLIVISGLHQTYTMAIENTCGIKPKDLNEWIQYRLGRGKATDTVKQVDESLLKKAEQLDLEWKKHKQYDELTNEEIVARLIMPHHISDWAEWIAGERQEEFEKEKEALTSIHQKDASCQIAIETQKSNFFKKNSDKRHDTNDNRLLSAEYILSEGAVHLLQSRAGYNWMLYPQGEPAFYAWLHKNKITNKETGRWLAIEHKRVTHTVAAKFNIENNNPEQQTIANNNSPQKPTRPLQHSGSQQALVFLTQPSDDNDNGVKLGKSITAIWGVIASLDARIKNQSNASEQCAMQCEIAYLATVLNKISTEILKITTKLSASNEFKGEVSATQNLKSQVQLIKVVFLTVQEANDKEIIAAGINLISLYLEEICEQFNQLSKKQNTGVKVWTTRFFPSRYADGMITDNDDKRSSGSNLPTARIEEGNQRKTKTQKTIPQRFKELFSK